MGILMVYYYTLEVCLVTWMQYKSVCENLTNMFLLHHVCMDF
jgi:ribosomal protein L32